MKRSGHAGLSGNASTSTKSCGFSDCQAERNGEGSLLGCWEKVAMDVLTVSDLASMRLLAEIHKFTRERVMSHLATMKKCYYFLRFLYVELKLVGLAHRSLRGHQYGTRPYYRSPRGELFVDLCGVFFFGKIWLMVVLATTCGGFEQFLFIHWVLICASCIILHTALSGGA